MGTSNYTKTMEKILAKAENENLVLTVAQANEVFIDIDDSLDIERVKTAVHNVHTLFRPVSCAYWRVSKGGQGLHVVITMRHPVTDTERTTIAACCGSDPKRELLRLRALHFQTDDTLSLLLDKAGHSSHLLVEYPYVPEVRPEKGAVETVTDPADAIIAAVLKRSTEGHTNEDSNNPVVVAAPTDDVQPVSPQS